MRFCFFAALLALGMADSGVADSDKGEADCAACGSELSESQIGHCCRACKRSVHSWVVCDKVWQPDFGAYFCSRRCIIDYNNSDEIRSQYVDPEPLPVRHRPEAHSEEEEEEEQPAAQPKSAGPLMRTLSRHSGADFESGRTGHRNGEGPPGTEFSEDSEPDVPLMRSNAKKPVKQTAAAVRPKRKGKAAAAPAAAPAAAIGLAAFGFGGATKPAERPLPKRGAQSSKRTARTLVQPGLAMTEEGQVAQTTALWDIGNQYGDSGSDNEGGETEGEGPAKRPKVSLRKMEAGDLKEYKAEKYKARQAKAQDELAKKYTWLACDPARGRHCSQCVQQPSGLRASDKLSIGYGTFDDGSLCPIPSEAKCVAHAEKKEHINAVRNNQVPAAIVHRLTHTRHGRPY